MTRLHLELIRASYLHKRACRQAFQELSLSEGQPKVLSTLMKKEGYLQKDLAKMCRVEPATMTSLLKKMTANRLIIKESVHVSGGKRAYGIYLSDEGRAKGKRIEEIVDTLEEVSFKGFSEEEKEQLLSYLGRVSENLSAYSEENGD